ncbi:hypothetical protein CLOM_g9739 [Closterium sp. NIES-68]|nr:hypothetical protein CLOM_g9739 [Closterium sp. NIES-68]GJP63547.1 hypothetical protein CLOP_g20611 [Closterium sp. NIES-67]
MSFSQPLGPTRRTSGKPGGIRQASSSTTYGSTADRFKNADPQDKENKTALEQQKKRKLELSSRIPVAPVRTSSTAPAPSRQPLGLVVHNSDAGASHASSTKEPPSASDPSTVSEDPFKEQFDSGLDILYRTYPKLGNRTADMQKRCDYQKEYIRDLKACINDAGKSYALKQISDAKLEEESKLRRTAEEDALVWKQKAEEFNASLEELKAQLEDAKKTICRFSDEDTRSKATIQNLQTENDQLVKRSSELATAKDALSEDAEQKAKDLIAVGKDLDEKVKELGLLHAEKMELERNLDTLKVSLQSANVRLEEVKARLQDSEKLLQDKGKELFDLNAEVATLKERSAASERLHSVERSLLQDQIDMMTKEKEDKDADILFHKNLVNKLTGEVEARRAEVGVKDDKLKGLEGLSQSECDLRTEITRLRRELAEREQLFRQKDLLLQEMEKRLKLLHNRLMLLKGNIRVFCRVRPLSSKEEERSHSAMAVRIPENNIDNKIAVQGHEGDFKFDKVFPPATTQTAVFEDISDLVTSALDGYKVCIFAYGQTGSGKTFTMFGDTMEEALRGVIPRSMDQIFKVGREKSTLGWEYTIQASLLEIHNESIRDLLKGFRNEEEASTSKPEKGSAAAKKAELSLYNIIHEKDGSTTVVGLKVVTVQSAEDATELFAHAHKKRSVGRTDMNEESSRSHAVFTLRLNGRNRDTGETTRGILNLIDLAGSERLKKSNATGSTLTESIAINKSLSSLSHVLEARAKGELPRYRDGKLTYLLQKSIEKDSRTLMFLNISPDISSADETMGSLKFGAMVNSCDLGVATRDIRSAESEAEDRQRRASSSSSHQGSKKKG